MYVLRQCNSLAIKNITNYNKVLSQTHILKAEGQETAELLLLSIRATYSCTEVAAAG